MEPYILKITQTLTGYANIKANSPEDAMKIGIQKFVTDGEVLPDMDDTEPLKITVCDKYGSPIQEKG